MRRRVVAAAALLPTLAFFARAGAQQKSDQPAQDGSADFLFVQTSGTAFDADQNRLTLRSASPVTLFFTDRPERIAGNMKTEHFANAFWSEGKDSFLSDPPNADLSVLDDKGNLLEAVVVLRDPVLEGEDLHYTVEIIDGHLPSRRQRLALHRHHRDAAHATLLRRRAPPRLASGRPLAMSSAGGPSGPVWPSCDGMPERPAEARCYLVGGTEVPVAAGRSAGADRLVGCGGAAGCHPCRREGRGELAAAGDVPGAAAVGLVRPVRREAGRGAGRPDVVPAVLRLFEERGDAGAHGIRALPPGTGPSASRYPSRGLFMLLIFWGLGAARRDFPLKETT